MKKEKMTNTAKTPVWQKTQSGGGFTLVELLIVIAIMAALAVAVVVIINPAEFIKRGRDSTRLSDLASLNRALGLLLTQNYDDSFGDPNIVYTSLPDTDDSLPEDCDEYSLPSLPDGWSYSCRLISNFRNVDGSGWTPVDLTAFSAGSPLAVLPVDPVNSVTTGEYYTYVPGGSWELNGILLSSKYRFDSKVHKKNLPGVISIGSNINLSPIFNNNGLVGYWTFDEGSGGAAYDVSGNNNTGGLVSFSFSGDSNWKSASDCKVSGCLSFGGSWERVHVSHNSVFNFGTSSFSASGWFKVIPGKNINYTGLVRKPTERQYNMFTGWTIGFWGNNILIENASIRGFIADGTRKVTVIGGSVGSYGASSWHMITMVADRSTNILHLYVDGNEVGVAQSIATVGSVSNSSMLTIGRDNTYFPGKIDDVRVYNRALSPAEIKAMYNAAR